MATVLEGSHRCGLGFLRIELHLTSHDNLLLLLLLLRVDHTLENVTERGRVSEHFEIGLHESKQSLLKGRLHSLGCLLFDITLVDLRENPPSVAERYFLTWPRNGTLERPRSKGEPKNKLQQEIDKADSAIVAQ